MAQIQIRFNTEREKNDPSALPWRVLIDGHEHLARLVRIEVPTWTSEDILPSGQKKWHLSCAGEAVWVADECVIEKEKTRGADTVR